MYTHDPSIDEYRPFMVEANRRLNVIQPDRIEWLLTVWHPFNNHGWRSYEVRRNSGIEMSKEDKKAIGLGHERMSIELWDAITDPARRNAVAALDKFFLTAGRLHAMAREKWIIENDSPSVRLMLPMLKLSTQSGCAAALPFDGALMSREDFLFRFPFRDCDKPACACHFRAVTKREIEQTLRKP